MSLACMFQFILIKRRAKKSASTWSQCVALQMLKVIRGFNNTFKRSISFCFDNSSRRSELNILAALTKEEFNILFSKIFSSLAIKHFWISFIKLLIWVVLMTSFFLFSFFTTSIQHWFYQGQVNFHHFLSRSSSTCSQCCNSSLIHWFDNYLQQLLYQIL